jgi:hypothetical protein
MGRLGSTGLPVMPSERQQSWHSGAYLQQLQQPSLDTISDDYGPATSCRRLDIAAAARARATHMSLLWACWSSWRMRAGATALRDRRLRDRRERADMPVQSPGLATRHGLGVVSPHTTQEV